MELVLFGGVNGFCRALGRARGRCMAILDLDIPQLCGQLLVVGFSGETLPEGHERAFSEGLRGGAILFRRNLPDVATTLRVCGAIASAAPRHLPPFIGIDQEGGRVTRLPAPFLALPPMRVLGSIGALDLTRRAAVAVGTQLRAAGINLDFAPVLDVDSNPENPIIGDRSFGADPELVARHGVAFAEGLESCSVLACGKHFPGHGDTSVDSHVDLPVVPHDRSRLDRIELVPFRATAKSGIATLMTAHIVCEAIEPGVPATLSPRICTDLLRHEIGFRGVLFSDDLEMKAVFARYPIEQMAVLAVRAGCDALLVCHDEDLQARAHVALIREAERDSGFRDRCIEAVARSLDARRKVPPSPNAEGLDRAFECTEAILDEIARRQQS